MTNGYEDAPRLKALYAPAGKTLALKARHKMTPQGLAVEWHIRCVAGTRLILTNGVPWPDDEDVAP
jgi:hypothetical protein